jgi:hypothetical protein
VSATPDPRSPLLREIETLLGQLTLGPVGPEQLLALRERLLRGDPRQAIAAIVEFLRTGRDAPTGQEFGVGEGGTLAGAPTLRVFLMDLLGQISRSTRSGEAAAVARTVLEKKTTPDEWALSLRNVAWHEPAATGYLAGKVREMLAEPAWTATPSPALLEAFDVIAYSGDPSFIPELAAMAGGALTPMQRAATMALDRLSEKSPLAVMQYLNAHPAEVSDRPLARADYFAKADLAQPAQQAALEAYLSRPDVALNEKTKLVKALASPGSFSGDSLLMTASLPVDDTARQQQLAATYQRWLGANRFPELAAPMQQVLARLQP